MAKKIKIVSVDDDGRIHFSRQPRTFKEWEEHPVVKEIWREQDGCFHHYRPSIWVQFKEGFSTGEYEMRSGLHEANLRHCLNAFDVYAFRPPDWVGGRSSESFREHKAKRIAEVRCVLEAGGNK